MREKLDEPMHISEVMTEYLQELETQYETQAAVNDSGFTSTQNQETP